MPFLKNDPALVQAALKPAQPYRTPLPGNALGGMASTYNDVGGLIDALAARTGIPSAAVLAVWYVESSGRTFTPNQAIIRFENHVFFKYWGSSHPAQFDEHFQYGGRNGVAGKASKNHKFRANGGAWKEFHNLDQSKEYEVYEFAKGIGGPENAAKSTSFGGPQIMGFNFDICGYSSAVALASAFQADARWHVLGFFDYCKARHLIEVVEQEDWHAFGERYNGQGGGPIYGPKIKAAYDCKDALAQLPRA
jgi:hypothetical protein